VRGLGTFPCVIESLLPLLRTNGEHAVRRDAATEQIDEAFARFLAANEVAIGRGIIERRNEAGHVLPDKKCGDERETGGHAVHAVLADERGDAWPFADTVRILVKDDRAGSSDEPGEKGWSPLIA